MYNLFRHAPPRHRATCAVAPQDNSSTRTRALRRRTALARTRAPDRVSLHKTNAPIYSRPHCVSLSPLSRHTGISTAPSGKRRRRSGASLLAPQSRAPGYPVFDGLDGGQKPRISKLSTRTTRKSPAAPIWRMPACAIADPRVRLRAAAQPLPPLPHSLGRLPPPPASSPACPPPRLVWFTCGWRTRDGTKTSRAR